MYLASNIRYLRRGKEMSQEYLADKLGYKSYTTIQKWESGIAEPSLAQLSKLADIFGVDLNDLVQVDLSRPIEHTEPKKPLTIAAHATEDLNEEDIEEIYKFIDFIKSKKK